MYTEKPVMESTEIDESEANTVCSKSTTHTPVFSTTVPSSTLGNTSQQLIFNKSEIFSLNFISQQLSLQILSIIFEFQDSTFTLSSDKVYLFFLKLSSS